MCLFNKKFCNDSTQKKKRVVVVLVCYLHALTKIYTVITTSSKTVGNCEIQAY